MHASKAMGLGLRYDKGIYGDAAEPFAVTSVARLRGDKLFACPSGAYCRALCFTQFSLWRLRPIGRALRQDHLVPAGPFFHMRYVGGCVFYFLSRLYTVLLCIIRLVVPIQDFTALSEVNSVCG